MKKVNVLAVCLASFLALSMVGCGSGSENGESSTNSYISESNDANESSESEESEDGNSAESNAGNISADVSVVNESSVVYSTKTKTEVAESDAEDYETLPEEESVEENSESLNFKLGVWEAEDCFYYFENKNAGGTSSYENHMGTPFRYEISADGSGIFHMGSLDDQHPVTVSFADENTAIILWDNDVQVRLNYLQGYTRDDFENFYDDSLLIDLAKQTYRNATDTEPDSAEISGTNGLYAPVSVYVNGEVVATYAVNRCTLRGTCEETGEEVIFLTSLNG